jgi:hypothetical protein
VYWPVHDLWHDPEGLEMMLTVHNIEDWLVYPGVEKMARQGYSYDFISDALLETLEFGVGGLLSGEGKVKHRVLVIPECRFMPLSTLQKIIGLAGEGALVIFQVLPEDVPGLYNLEERRERFNRVLSSLQFTETGEGIGEFSAGKGIILLCQDPGKALAYAGIPGERITGFGLKFTRRATEEGHIYYLVNHTAEPVDAWIPLQHGGRHVLILDPQDGSFGEAQTSKENGEARVRIQLQAGKALFLKTSDKNAFRSIPWPYEKQRLQPHEIEGTWKLSFSSGGPVLPGPLEMEAPLPYTDLDDPSLKAFCGLSTYEATFSFSRSEASDYLLHLGKVYESARVRLNGTDLGFFWSIPFEARVGHLLNDGENHLEIEVANLMANRIRSMDKAKIPWRIFHEINFVNIDYEPFDASAWAIEPSGLAGPVVLLPLEY